jgi:hypothetical protein
MEIQNTFLICFLSTKSPFSSAERVFRKGGLPDVGYLRKILYLCHVKDVVCQLFGGAPRSFSSPHNIHLNVPFPS